MTPGDDGEMPSGSKPIIWQWMRTRQKKDYYDYNLDTSNEIEKLFVNRENDAIVKLHISEAGIDAWFDFAKMTQNTYPYPNSSKKVVRRIRRIALLAGSI